MKINNIKIKIKRDDFLKKLGIENGKPGEPGKDYVLTNADKKEIASKITIPVVEKVIEKTEVIKEAPTIDETILKKIKQLISGAIKKITWDDVNDKPDFFQMIRQVISAKTYSLKELDDVNLTNAQKDSKGNYVISAQPDLSSYISETFETVSKNIKSYPYAFNKTGSVLDSITYTLPIGTIVKTFNRTGTVLDSVVLSGATPSGISLTKTFNRTGGVLTSITYS